jgi:hypothetical protein
MKRAFSCSRTRRAWRITFGSGIVSTPITKSTLRYKTEATRALALRHRCTDFRLALSDAEGEQLNSSKPEYQHCQRYRVAFEPNTHDYAPRTVMVCPTQ